MAISLQRRLVNVDPREIIRLGEIATAAPVDKTTPEEIQLREYAIVYRISSGILSTVPGIGEKANQELAEKARTKLVAYVPTKIRDMN